MAKYRDGMGREWDVTIPGFGTVARLRAEVGIDLNAVGGLDGELAQVLVGNLERAIEGVWFLIRGEAEKRGIHHDQFLDAVTDSRAIRAALVDAVFDFFHPSRAKEMSAILPALMHDAEAVILSTLSGLAGNSPESSESAPKT